MIISIRGPSGSGKSTLVRRVTALYAGGGTPYHVDGRRRAYYTTHVRESGLGTALVVPGHYDIANGGVDTLDDLDQAYGIALDAHSRGHDVLMEGKCMSDGTRKLLELRRAAGTDVRVLHLTTGKNRCVKNVRNRGHSISVDSIFRVHDKVYRDVQIFRTMGVDVRAGSGDECLSIMKHWLAL